MIYEICPDDFHVVIGNFHTRRFELLQVGPSFLTSLSMLCDFFQMDLGFSLLRELLSTIF